MILRLGAFLRSIRFRLALWFATILAVVLVAFSVFIYTRTANDLTQGTLNRLNYKTRQWEAYLKYGANAYFGENPPLIPRTTEDGKPFLQDSDILALIGPQGEPIQKVGPIQDTDVQELVEVGLQKASDNHPFSYPVVAASTGSKIIREEYRFVVAPITYDRRIIGFFLLGSPVDPDHQLQGLLATLLVGNLATLALALAGGTWLANRAMRPVQTITRAAREIGETDLSRRLNLTSQDELGELADTFDSMLARLEAAFNRQRQFTADASHELRTPLTIIGLETGRALSARRTPLEYQRVLHIVQSENEFMTRLVGNLLTLSRMDAGQTTLAFETLDLSDVALEVVERMAPLAERRQVDLSAGELPELPILGDRTYLSQMMTNLVENALKYTRPEGAQVRVETGWGADQKDVFFQVQDNGPGIAREHWEHLFDRFYQVDAARSQNLEEREDEVNAGSGLGLSIVRWIAEAHHGAVEVQSEVGQGTVFTVRLPSLSAVSAP